MTMTFATVRRLASGLADVETGTMFGKPALKVRGQMFACITSHKSAEPQTLAVRASVDERDALIGADPDTFYLTDHYVDYPVVLVRLTRIRPDALRDLLRGAWQFVSSRRERPVTGRRRRVGPRQ
jgi:hypothetical protein